MAVKLATGLMSPKRVTPGEDVNRGRTSRVAGHVDVEPDTNKADADPKSEHGETVARRSGVGAEPLEEKVVETPKSDETPASTNSYVGEVKVIVRGRDSIHDHAKTNGDHCIRQSGKRRVKTDTINVTKVEASVRVPFNT